MAFLRISRGVVRGKKFTTRKSAAEYLYRLNTNTLACSEGGGTCGFAHNYYECKRGKYAQKNGQASAGRVIGVESGIDWDTSPVNVIPRKFKPAVAGVMRRVYRHGLLWRVTVENIWQSDHATMEDALSGINAIGVEPEPKRDGVVFVPQ